MKYVNRKQSLIITGSTAQEFQEKLNEALNSIASNGRKHEIQFNMNMGLCAYILYDERLEIPESIADEYELKGETYDCGECPMFRPSDDRRVKYTTCAKGYRRRGYCDPCCDWFYEALEGGEITLNDEGCTTDKDIE